MNRNTHIHRYKGDIYTYTYTHTGTHTDVNVYYKFIYIIYDCKIMDLYVNIENKCNRLFEK